MAKKKTVDVSKDEIRKLLKSKKLIIGTDRVTKLAKQAKLDKVFISRNAPKTVLDDLDHYCKLGNIEVIRLQYANDEVGEMCNKPFSISILGVLKA